MEGRRREPATAAHGACRALALSASRVPLRRMRAIGGAGQAIGAAVPARWSAAAGDVDHAAPAFAALLVERASHGERVVRRVGALEELEVAPVRIALVPADR